MRKLLRFLVDYKLSETDVPLKAYSIAVDALGRDESFDTQVDSYPRVQMGRLRRMLDHFYRHAPGENRLAIPYNHYEIMLIPNNAGNSAGNPDNEPDLVDPDPAVLAENGAAVEIRFRGKSWSINRAPLLVLLAAIISLAIGATYYSQRTAPSNRIAYPAIIVKSPEGIVSPSNLSKTEMIQTHLVGALDKFDQIRIFDEDAELEDRSQYLLESSVLNEEADRIQVRLIDRATKEVVWSDRIETIDGEAMEANLDAAVVAIASPYGAVALQELSKYRDDFTPGYPCLLQFHQYMRYRDQKILKPVLGCMNASAKKFASDPYLLSMLVVAKPMSERFADQGAIEGSVEQFADQAAKIDTNSASANFAVAQSAFFDGDCRKGVAWGKHAVELNPLNSRITGYLGLYMLACQLPEGEEYAERALRMDPNADLAIAATLVVQKLRSGDAEAARDLALEYRASAKGSTPGLDISYILSTAMLGDKQEARRAWKRLAVRSGLPETAATRLVLEKWIANPDLVRELELLFEQAQI